MKKYIVKIAFFGPLRYRNYLFIETDLKNPKGDILFEGLPVSGRDYVFHYTESTLQKMGAKQQEINLSS